MDSRLELYAARPCLPVANKRSRARGAVKLGRTGLRASGAAGRAAAAALLWIGVLLSGALPLLGRGLASSVGAPRRLGAAPVPSGEAEPPPEWIMRVVAPELVRFVARATVAVEPEAFVWERGGESPYTLFDGARALATQCDLVGRHADGSAALVELSAVVERGQRRAGSWIELRVDRERGSAFGMAAPGAAAWALATSKAAVGLRAVDGFGNDYVAPLAFGKRPERGGGENAAARAAHGRREFHRLGPVQVTAGSSEALRPLAASDSALEAFGWVQHWLTARAGSDVVQLILNWHNGGGVAGDPARVLERLYFDRIELVLPAGWNVISEMPMPGMGELGPARKGQRVLPLIDSSADGRLHLLPQNRQTAFRLTLYPDGAEAEARAYAANAGAGSCPESFRGSTGRGWGIERYPLARLDHLGDVAARVRRRHAAIRDAFAAGRNASGLGGDDMIGPYHVWGPKYGGVTGGNEKDAVLGMEEACAGVPEGALWLRMRMDATANRMDDFAIYAADGGPVRPGAFANADGSTPWKYFDRWLKRSWPERGLDADLPWAWSQVEPRQVIAEERRPSYETRLAYDPPKNARGYQAVDGQHYSRWYGPCQALVFLDNDPLARLNLRMSATLARMAYWERSGGRLAGIAKPKIEHVGGALGRGEAQVLSAACASWFVADDAWRAEFQPFFRLWSAALEPNITRSGVLSGSSTGKLITAHGFAKGYRVCRANPQSVLMNALRGLMQGPLAAEPEAVAQVASILERMGAVGLWEHLWAKDADGSRLDGTWTHVALGPLKPATGEDMFAPGEHPAVQFRYVSKRDGTSKEVTIDRFRLCLGLGVYYGLVRGTEREEQAWEMLRQHLGPDPLAQLESEGDRFFANRYGLLGLLQDAAE